jgi:hypothetical protein
VSITELTSALSPAYDPDQGADGMNYYPGLTTRTLPLGKVLEYSHVHRLPQEVVSGLRRLMKERNTLHFIAGELPAALQGRDLRTLVEYNAAVIEPRADAVLGHLHKRQRELGARKA